MKPPSQTVEQRKIERRQLQSELDEITNRQLATIPDSQLRGLIDLLSGVKGRPSLERYAEAFDELTALRGSAVCPIIVQVVLTKLSAERMRRLEMPLTDQTGNPRQ